MSGGTAVVVGGGIGGLAAAVGLHRIGWSAVVLEQTLAISEGGAGLSLWPNALRSLDVLGVGEQVRASGVSAVSRGGIRLNAGHFHPVLATARVMPPSLWRRQITRWTDWTPPAITSYASNRPGGESEKAGGIS
jgi:2-polyprenyl-6-methoxyphenol hydroxylase-like FAD-dependent oxidoreductase